MSDTDTEQTTRIAPQLSAVELRVLGVLMEKQLTTPEQYPLTLNSVITACNQKSSREPVTNYAQGEVLRALNELDNKHFIRRQRGARAEKFEQLFMNHLELGRKQQALLCVMMLRGPQSLSELGTRTQRMCEFVDREELELCVDRLCQREVPYTVRLAQQPGQRGERIMHVFGGAVDTSIVSQSNKPHATHAYASAATITAPTENVSSENVSSEDVSSESLPHSASDTATNESIAIDALKYQLANLQDTVALLQLENEELKISIKKLYELTGHTSPIEQAG